MKCVYILTLLLIISSCSTLDNKETSEVFNNAIDAVGGKDALLDIHNIQVTSSGETYYAYMGLLPEQLKQTGKYTKKYSYNLSLQSMRTDVVRQFTYEPNHGFPKQEYYTVTKGGLGAVSNGAMPLGLPGGHLPIQAVASMERLALFMNPNFILRETLENKRNVLSVTRENKHYILKISDDVSPIDLHIDGISGRILKLETLVNHLLLRDSSLVTTYKNWNRSDKLWYPQNVELSIGGKTLRNEVRSSLQENITFSNDFFDLPESTTQQTPDKDSYRFGLDTLHIHDEFFEIAGLYYGESSKFISNELSPNVYEIRDHTMSHLAGMAISVDNNVILVEAHTSPKSGDQYLEAVKSLFPGQSITHLIQSHHHVDHASGVRSVVAAGAVAVVGHGVGKWWQQVLNAKSTIRPDTLSRVSTLRNQIMELEKNGSMAFRGDAIQVTAYHIEHNSHASDMLITAIETGKEVFLYVADLYNAGFGFTMSYDGPKDLFRALKTIGLLDDKCKSNKPFTFIPAHGRATTLEQAIAELRRLNKNIGCTS